MKLGMEGGMEGKVKAGDERQAGPDVQRDVLGMS